MSAITGMAYVPGSARGVLTRTGYASGARTFGMMVATALAKDGRFKRLSRGQYERIA